MTTTSYNQGSRICWRCPVCGWERFTGDRAYTAVYCKNDAHDPEVLCQPHAYVPYEELTRAKNRVLVLREAIKGFIAYARSSGTWGRDPDLSVLKDALLEIEKR